MQDVLRFLEDEQGTWVDYLMVLLIAGLGGAAALFGVLGALRGLGGKNVQAIECLDPTNPDPACTP